MNLGKQYKIGFLAMSVCYLALGVVLLFLPSVTLYVMCYALGGVTVLYGVIHLVFYFAKTEFDETYRLDFVTGVVMASIGVYLIAQPEKMSAYLPVVVGIAICLDSLVKLQNAIDLCRLRSRIWWTVLLLALVTGGMGAALIFARRYEYFTLSQVLGASLILDGCVNIWSLLFLSLNLKRLRKERVLAQQIAEAAEQAEPDPQAEILRPSPAELGEAPAAPNAQAAPETAAAAAPEECAAQKGAEGGAPQP